MSFFKLKWSFFISNKFLNILSYFFFGIIGTILIKGNVTPLLLDGRGFAGRNIFIKSFLFLTYFAAFILLLYLINWLVNKIKSIRKPSSIDNNTDIIIKNPSNLFYFSLITFSLGVFVIFLITNIITRIDTVNWTLSGHNIIPIMNPIGNDFRVGLYWPAENLLKSGFSAIGPDGTYPSIYPPLVSILSLFYLFFDIQTAFVINTIFLFIFNFLIIVIASLMIYEFLFKKVFQDKSTRIVSSILLFILMAFYNYSGYSFLFSIERGNVDAIAMFFLMLSMWTLVKQPKNIWLQVIFLSIATHYKIYPAALFLILLYCHGKKLILPALIVNLAFLFILGPNIAFSFIASLTAGGSGAGVGNQWTWIGNHAAYSFAVGLTRIYPALTDFLNSIFLACMLIPFSVWIQGTIRLLREKYSAINALLLLMISIPLMDLLPTISNDYRLIIESVAFILFIGLILTQILRNPSKGKIFELVLVLIIMFFIARPYVGTPEVLLVSPTYFIDNKYLWIFALECLMVFNISQHLKQNPNLNS